MPDIEIVILQPSSPELATCARWRVEAFGDVLENSVADEVKALEAMTANDNGDVMLAARCDGVLAGTCLLVQSEIDPVHDVAPWLAGLFVAPEHRRHGVGAALVRAIEEQAQLRGHPRIHLYTDEAERFYEHLGWTAIDRFDWKGWPTVLMVRGL